MPILLTLSQQTIKSRPSQSQLCTSQSSFLHPSSLFRCIVPQNHLHKKSGTRPCSQHERAPDHKSPSSERRPVADPDFSSAAKDSTCAQKPHTSAPEPHVHVYDFLYQLNEAFVRVQRRIALLDQVGIFRPTDHVDAHPPV